MEFVVGNDTKNNNNNKKTHTHTKKNNKKQTRIHVSLLMFVSIHYFISQKYNSSNI